MRLVIDFLATGIDWPTLDPTAQISAFVKLKFANCANSARRECTPGFFDAPGAIRNRCTAHERWSLAV
jgi:hypothetical protein